MPMTRNQTKVRTETRNHGPEPCSVLFSGRAAAIVEDDGSKILQLNVEGLTNSKLTIIEQLAHANKVTAILLQETHCGTTEKPTMGGGGRTRLPKFKFSVNFPIGLQVILQLQIKKNQKCLISYVK